MINDLLEKFMGSQHADEAVAALQKEQGLTADQARGAVDAAAQATKQHADESGDPTEAIQKFGTLGNAAAGGIGGMLSGGGMRGAVEGGIGSVIAGRAAQMVAQRTGINPSTASSVAAIATPFVLRYLQQHLGGMMGGAQSAPGGAAMAGGKPAMAPDAKSGVGGDAVPPWKRGL